jgi:D-lactate dehydrogenase (cytochrome)
MRLTAALPGGQVIHTGCRAPKSSSGYDLTRLFVGSEGTLGIAVEATLRLTGLPAHHLAATVTFDRLEQASQAVAVLIGSGLTPAALELLPPALIRLMNREKHLGLVETPTLFYEFHGISPEMLAAVGALAEELCADCGATGFVSGVTEAARKDLWRARHGAWETIHRAHPGQETLIVDAAVPLSRYPEMVVFAQKLIDDFAAVGYVFGHAGDGNLHVVLVGNPDVKDRWRRLEGINQRIVTWAVQLGGTCTGEHGGGIGKRRFMQLEHGESAHLMKGIKSRIDPKGLMNPGKIFLEDTP